MSCCAACGTPLVGGKEPFSRLPSPGEQTAAVLANERYRHIMRTEPGAVQVGAMTINAATMGAKYAARPSVGWEAHPNTTQYFAVEEGEGIFTRAQNSFGLRINLENIPVKKGDKWFVAPGWWHDIEPIPGTTLRLLTAYMPPHHPPGTNDDTRVAAEERKQSGTP